MEDNSAQKRVKADGQKGGRLSRLNPKTLINPSLRHAPQLDHAYERAAISANLSQEEKGLLDALDLARWLYVSPEKKSTRAGLFWGAIQWLASERASTKGADRDDEALLQLEIIRKELPIKQLSQSTLKAYEDSLRAMYYWSQSKRAPDAESIAFVDTLAAAEDMLAREDLSARAKWNYRSALLWHLDQGGEGNERNERARALLNEPESKPEKGKRKQGAVISETDLLKILGFLEGKVATERKDKGVSTAAMTIIWIHAGLATGLRPAEWLDAKWAGKEKSALETISAKTKVGRVGFLPETDRDGLERQAMEPMQTRTITVASPGDRAAVEKMLSLIEMAVPPHESRSSRQKALNKIYLAVKQRLYTVSQGVFKGEKHYSLYAFRRQFASNAKAAYGVEVTSQMMGHVSADSPSAGYYGKSNQAHGRFKEAMQQRKLKERQTEEKGLNVGQADLSK